MCIPHFTRGFVASESGQNMGILSLRTAALNHAEVRHVKGLVLCKYRGFARILLVLEHSGDFCWAAGLDVVSRKAISRECHEDSGLIISLDDWVHLHYISTTLHLTIVLLMLSQSPCLVAWSQSCLHL